MDCLYQASAEWQETSRDTPTQTTANLTDLSMSGMELGPSTRRNTALLVCGILDELGKLSGTLNTLVGARVRDPRHASNHSAGGRMMALLI